MRLRRTLGYEDEGAADLAALLETFTERAGGADVLSVRAQVEAAL